MVFLYKFRSVLLRMLLSYCLHYSPSILLKIASSRLAVCGCSSVSINFVVECKSTELTQLSSLECPGLL